MAMFTKKPVKIEARQFTNVSDAEDLLGWIRSAGGNAWRDGETICFQTTAGTKCASIGKWIVKSEEGPFDVYEPEDFENTYERVWPGEVRRP